MKRYITFALLSLTSVIALTACITTPQPTTFTVRIDNISAVTDSSGAVATIITPGVAVVGTSDPLFSAGQKDRGEGLEGIAEGGNPSGYADREGYVIFNTPVGESTAGPATSNKSYSFTIEAIPGEYLAFATMFVESNDLFFAPEASGIALFDNGKAISGDVTDQISLWDAGTEVNEEPGVGANQPIRNPSPDAGTVENGNVRKVDDGFSYPNVNSVLRVTLTPLSNR